MVSEGSGYIAVSVATVTDLACHVWLLLEVF
jgi:hypothetical protein